MIKDLIANIYELWGLHIWTNSPRTCIKQTCTATYLSGCY
jgi:hypothetical protein